MGTTESIYEGPQCQWCGTRSTRRSPDVPAVQITGGIYHPVTCWPTVARYEGINPDQLAEYLATSEEEGLPTSLVDFRIYQAACAEIDRRAAEVN